MHRLVCCGALACFATLVHAQTTPAPKPPPELTQLDYYAGRWSCEGVTKPDNAKYAVTRQCAWSKVGFVLECRAHWTTPNEREGVAIYGFNTVERAYTEFGYGSTDANAYVWKGQHTGTTWTFTREGTFQGKPAKLQYVRNEASRSKFFVQMRRAVEGGSWTVTSEGSCTRQE